MCRCCDRASGKGLKVVSDPRVRVSVRGQRRSKTIHRQSTAMASVLMVNLVVGYGSTSVMFARGEPWFRVKYFEGKTRSRHSSSVTLPSQVSDLNQLQSLPWLTWLRTPEATHCLCRHSPNSPPTQIVGYRGSIYTCHRKIGG